MRCKTCRNNISNYARICPYCKTEIVHKQNVVEEYLEKLEKNPFQIKEQRKLGEFHFNRYAKAAVACVMMAAIMFCYTYYKKANDWDMTEDTIFYRKENNLVARNLNTENGHVISTSLLDEDSIVSNTDVNSVETEVLHVDKEGQYFYYATDIGIQNDVPYYSIYKKDCTNSRSKAICVADKVYSSKWINDGLYYTTYNTRELYYYDGNEETSLSIKGVINMLYNEELNRLVIQASSDYLTSSLSAFSSYEMVREVYVLDCNNNQTTFVLDNYIQNAIVEDVSAIYYIEECILYKYDIATYQRIQVATNVRDFVYVNSETEGGLYYIRYELEPHSAIEYYIDEYLEADKKTESSPSLQGMETKEEYEDRMKRSELRENLKNYEVYLYNTTLYLHTEESEKEIVNGAAEFNIYIRSQEQFPSYYKLANADISFKYEDVEDDIELENFMLSSFFFYKEDSNIDCWSESIKDYDRVASEADWGYVDVCIMEDYWNMYLIKGGKEVEYDQSSDEILLYDTYIVNNYQDSIDASKITVADTEYYIEGNDLSLMKSTKDGSTECILDLVEGYRILGEGNLLVRIYDDSSGEYNLLHINKEEIVTIDTGVEGIYGENTWNYYKAF